jgi:uncharacterized protein (DUF2267 family)
MQYSEFMGQVHHRARVDSMDKAVAAVRATLTVLGQRLAGGEPDDLAAELPNEIGRYLKEAEPRGQRFGFQEFMERVSQEEGVDLPEAVHHARVVIEVLQEAVSVGEIEDVRAQLPAEFDPLFESGSEGTLGQTA